MPSLCRARANLCRIVPVSVLRCIVHWLHLGDRPTPCFHQTRCALHFSSCRRVRVLLAGHLLRGACLGRSWSALPVADRPTPLPATSSRNTFLVSPETRKAGCSEPTELVRRRVLALLSCISFASSDFGTTWREAPSPQSGRVAKQREQRVRRVI